MANNNKPHCLEWMKHSECIRMFERRVLSVAFFSCSFGIACKWTCSNQMNNYYWFTRNAIYNCLHNEEVHTESAQNNRRRTWKKKIEIKLKWKVYNIHSNNEKWCGKRKLSYKQDNRKNDFGIAAKQKGRKEAEKIERLNEMKKATNVINEYSTHLK